MTGTSDFGHGTGSKVDLEDAVEAGAVIAVLLTHQERVAVWLEGAAAIHVCFAALMSVVTSSVFMSTLRSLLLPRSFTTMKDASGEKHNPVI